MNLQDWAALPGLTRAETLERAGLFHALKKTRPCKRGLRVCKRAAAKWLGIARNTLLNRLNYFALKKQPIEVEDGRGGGRRRYKGPTPTAAQLLRYFGVDSTHRGSFWVQGSEWLQGLIDAANRRRLELIKAHHPDRSGSAAKAAEVNEKWRRLRKIFRARGFEARR